MAALLDELKRRKVIRAGVAYAVVAWLLIEVVSTVFPILQIPEWPVALVTVLLILGFPVAVLPFANLSPDPDNAFFAAGVHETILNELVNDPQAYEGHFMAILVANNMYQDPVLERPVFANLRERIGFTDF